MSEYPKNDKEIRMWCLEFVSTGFEKDYSENSINEAQKVYDFICPLHSEEQPEQRKKSLARKFHSFLSRLKG